MSTERTKKGAVANYFREIYLYDMNPALPLGSTVEVTFIQQSKSKY